MRLVRFPGQPARVSGDIRAALTSLGRGRNVVGGIGLVGVQPPGTTTPVDAVLVLPHGVLVVVGVDLPEAAMRLDAPLDAQWKSDGWPLVCGDAVNPAAEPLARARALCERARALEPATAVGTVIAVGPFVDAVEQPPADLSGQVRVVYPTPTSMLAAAVSLASAERALSAEQARALILEFEPTAPEHDDNVLATEGFTTEANPLAVPSQTVPIDYPTAVAPLPARSKTGSDTNGTASADTGKSATSSTAVPAPVATLPGTRTTPVSTPSATPSPRPRPQVGTPLLTVPAAPPPVSAARQGRIRRRWQPFAAGALLLAVAAAIVAIVTTSGDDSGGATPPASSAPAVVSAGGAEFTERAAESTRDCAAHAEGDLQVALSGGGCLGLRRGSYETTAEGRPVAVSVAALTFADEGRATSFRELADTPGTGMVTDLAIETKAWPGSTPTFANAAYLSSASGVTVRVVLACELDGTSRADDPALADVARAALDIPLPQ